MKTLKYKGYVGSIEFSPEDNLLFGEILGIDGLVNYEGTTTQELTDSFHEAVEDYLAFCKDHNWTPQKSYSGAFNVRVSPDTHRQIANRASEAGISINAFVKKVLDEAVKEPASVMTPMVDGYDSHASELAMLMDPEGPVYGSRKEVKLHIPDKDIALLKELALRLGWEAFMRMREAALASGAADMSLEEINEEIDAARRER